MQTVANTVAGSGVFSLTSDENIEIKSTLGHINIEAIKDTDGWVSLKAAEDMFIQNEVPFIDTSHISIEEIASRILQKSKLERRY